MQANRLIEPALAGRHRGRASRSQRGVRTGLNRMIALSLFVVASCGAGITDALSGTAGMYVQTEDELAASGLAGGPFLPASMDYDISNVGTIPMTWAASADQPWVEVTPSNGVLDSLQSESVAVTFTPSAAQLQPGSYTANVSFVNQTDGVGNTSREVTLTVTAPGSQLMTTATRTTGVAPLAVHFDAVGSQSGVVQPAGQDPDHSTFAYEWNYGNPNSGNWPLTGKPRNRSVGWIGVHVYETPGTYRATLRVTDANGTTSDYHQDITVTDPNTVFASRTYHVAANGSDSWTGTQSQPFASIARAAQAAQGANAPTRIRVRRGDNFTVNSVITINGNTSPVLIDTYGTGAKPVLTFPAQGVGFNISGPDIRITELDLHCTSTTRDPWARGVYIGTSCLVHKCVVRGFGYGGSVSNSNFTCVSETEFLDSEQVGFYATGDHLIEKNNQAVIGCLFDGAGQHLMRTYNSRSTIAHNTFRASTFTAIKLGARNLPNPTRLNTIVGNTFESDVPDVVVVGPQNAGSSGEVALDHLFEANKFDITQQSPGSCFGIWAARATIRNNIFVLGNKGAVRVSPAWGVGPMPYRIRIEHNTAFAPASTHLELCDVTSQDQTTVRNNIVWCPNGTTGIGGTISATSNYTGNPGFANPAAGDFRVGPNSPARQGTQATQVRTDYLMARRSNVTAAGAID